MTSTFVVPKTRDEAIRWARRLSTDPQTVYLDTETTGFLGNGSEIIDVGIVSTNGETLLNTLVKPKRSIPLAAMQVHGITEEACKDAPPWETVGPNIDNWLAGLKVVIYNLDYDLPMMQQCNDECGMTLLTRVSEWHCAMLAYSAFDGTINPRFGSLKWHKLDAAADHFGIARGGHRALADAVTARKVVLAMAAEPPLAVES